MRILITGKGSYIGEHIRLYLDPFCHDIDEVDTIGDDWRLIDYSKYKAVIHVAAVVHNDAKKASEDLFKRINIDLPVQIAKLAKSNRVKQFVFLSSMAVYSQGKTLSKNDSIINHDTQPDATCGYGGSKLKAENLLQELEDDKFKVVIIRPPNVYGPGCRGNYIPLFKKLALKLYICPYAFSDIRQSMLYIDNLCELVRLILDTQSSGLFFPQDDIAPSTVELIKTIRGVYGKRTHYSRIFGFVVKICSNLSIIKKIYGGIQYKSELSNHFDSHYQIVKFITGIQNTINYKEE